MERPSLWFTVYTFSNYEQKVARDLAAMKGNLNLTEIEDIYVPMENYTTPTGKEKTRPKTPCYFYIKLKVDEESQPSTEIWYTIRNIKGSLGIINVDNYMISMSEEEFFEKVVGEDTFVSFLDKTN